MREDRDSQLEDIMSNRPNVADYIVRRLAREGITDCFGVAGDFAFQVDDAVARSEAIRWIGCSNELDAAYAADGYARMRGCSLLSTTYAVGELSALNGAAPSPTSQEKVAGGGHYGGLTPFSHPASVIVQGMAPHNRYNH